MVGLFHGKSQRKMDDLGDHHDLGNLQINKGAAKFHRWPPFWAVEEDALDAVETRKRPDWVR